MRGEERVEIGGVARAHGIRGEIVIVTHDPDSEVLADVDELYIRDQAFALTQCRHTHRGWLVAVAGVTTRNAAELLAGASVSVARVALQLAPDEVLLHDFVGCQVFCPDGTSWGEVVAIETGMQDRLVVIEERSTDAGPVLIERLLPVVDEFICSIDIATRRIEIDPPVGMPETVVRERPAIMRRVYDAASTADANQAPTEHAPAVVAQRAGHARRPSSPPVRHARTPRGRKRR